MSQALTTIEHELDGLTPQIVALLPPDVSPNKFREVALAAIRQKPDLLRCDRQSLFNACLNAAQDGLMPDGREGAIVPRKGRAVWQAMVQGIYKRVKTSGSVAALSANVVYDGEEFAVLLGDEERIVHRRDMNKVAPGQEVGVYAIATLRDGTKEREVMTWDEVMAVRQTSSSPNDGPWVTSPGEMARKTVVRRLAKRLPVLDQADERLHSAISRVDSLYDFGRPAQEAPPPPDRREAINAEVKLKTAAATTPRAPRRTEKPEVYETPPAEPQPERKTWAQLADALEIAERDTRTPLELGMLIAKAENQELVRLAREGPYHPTKARIIAAYERAETRYLADPPDPPEPDGELPEVEIAGEAKVSAG